MAKTQPRASAGEPLLPSAAPPPYLDSHSSDEADSYVLLVPVRLRRLRRGCRCRCLGPLLASLALLALAGFLLWPADPDVSVARLRLAHVSVAARPAVAVTISAALKVRVRNPDLFALDYSRLDVNIGYRGAHLGRVTSGGGRVRARAVSYIDADLRLDGIRVVEDAIYLLEDLARGSIPFDTVAEVEGHLRFFFLSIPVKGRISCVVHVNPHNQTWIHGAMYLHLNHKIGKKRTLQMRVPTEHFAIQLTSADKIVPAQSKMAPRNSRSCLKHGYIRSYSAVFVSTKESTAAQNVIGIFK